MATPINALKNCGEKPSKKLATPPSLWYINLVSKRKLSASHLRAKATWVNIKTGFVSHRARSMACAQGVAATMFHDD